jgi:hypothetical protein
MNNKFYQVAAVTFLSVFTSISNAENYNSEFTGSYISSDVDAEGQSSDLNTFGVLQKVYFSEVDTSVGPLGQAEFVSRTSSYSLGYSVIDDVNDTDTDITHAAVNLRHKDTGLTFALAYSFTDISSVGAISDQTDIRIGKYVGETTEVSLEYSREKLKQLDSLIEDAWALSISHVGTGDVGFAINGRFSMADKINDDEQFGIAVSAAVYPTRNIGLGAGFDIALAEEDSDRIFAFTEWFFKPNMKVAATYYISDQDNIDTNGFIIDLSYRLK